MSALGKHVLDGDFDANGQMVVQSPSERVLERSVVVTRTVETKPAPQPAPRPASVAKPVAQPDLLQDGARHNGQPPLPYPLAPRPKPSDLKLDRARDALLTPFGKATLTDRYLMPGESFQDMFARVSCAYADDVHHAQRLYDYMSRLWFMPATPILSNGGTNRGLPISCFLNDVPDSLDGIVSTWNENVALASNGGGIGTYWGKVRSIGEKVKTGKTSGIIPFIHVMDGLTLAISQGSLRRGSAAVYLDISHPEIEEFLEIRKASGDFNRKGLNLHHGINITDEFMACVRDGKPFGLRSPKDQTVLREIDARQLWQRILETRLQTGEPYILNIDAVNRALPKHQRELGLKVNTSNLCSEITLPTGADHDGKDRTAVCCLSSLNIETWDQWANEEGFVEDVLRMLDNVLTSFIEQAPAGMERAKYSALRERSVGLGVMGFHSFLQMKNIPLESAMAKSWNLRIFKKIRREADAASYILAEERGACPDAQEKGMKARFSHKLAIAPTASISIICGGASACVEPIPANVYTHKTLSGAFVVRNPYLQELLETKGANTPEVWQSIVEQEGSVQHLDCLSEEDKAVYRTAFEIDQRWIIELAADRTPYICQSQSLNLFLPADIDKWDLHMLHWTAWERGIKSLYYCRSKSISRAGFAGQLEKKDGVRVVATKTDYEECLACQSNLADIDPRSLIGKGTVGLLNATGTYDVTRYPWAYDCWKRQQQTHWMGEEVPLGADIRDWQSGHLTEAEKGLLTQIFRFFTQSDVEVGDNYLKRYIPIFQPLEVQMMMAAFSNMETVHIDAYALLLKTLGMPQAEFEAFRDYAEMKAKADYMHTFGTKTCADVARTLAMFGAFTEGMSLFASFAMLMNFPRFNKMNGMGQIVSWSVRDESLHCEGITKLYHAWNEETGCVTKAVRDDIRDVANTMVKLEEGFVDLAFSLGEVQGMKAAEIKSYVRYIADWRLTQLKLSPVFGNFEETESGYKQLKPHPLPWLVEILNGVEHANFFEQRATEYSKGASRGSWDGNEGVWANFDRRNQIAAE